MLAGDHRVELILLAFTILAVAFEALLFIQFLALGNLDGGVGTFVFAVFDRDAQALDVGGDVGQFLAIPAAAQRAPRHAGGVIDLAKVPADVQKAAFSVTIHDAEARKQNFGQVSNAYIRVVNKADGKEIARYDLSEDYSTETAMIFGEVYRHNGDWKFRAVGQGYSGGLAAMCAQYGIDVA